MSAPPCKLANTGCCSAGLTGPDLQIVDTMDVSGSQAQTQRSCGAWPSLSRPIPFPRSFSIGSTRRPRTPCHCMNADKQEGLQFCTNVIEAHNQLWVGWQGAPPARFVATKYVSRRETYRLPSTVPCSPVVSSTNNRNCESRRDVETLSRSLRCGRGDGWTIN